MTIRRGQSTRKTNARGGMGGEGTKLVTEPSATVPSATSLQATSSPNTGRKATATNRAPTTLKQPVTPCSLWSQITPTLPKTVASGPKVERNIAVTTTSQRPSDTRSEIAATRVRTKFRTFILQQTSDPDDFPPRPPGSRWK